MIGVADWWGVFHDNEEEEHQLTYKHDARAISQTISCRLTKGWELITE
jgi:hypothetical protein